MHLEKNVERAITHLLENPEEIALDYGEVTTNHQGSSAKRFLISSGVGYDQISARGQPEPTENGVK